MIVGSDYLENEAFYHAPETDTGVSRAVFHLAAQVAAIREHLEKHAKVIPDGKEFGEAALGLAATALENAGMPDAAKFLRDAEFNVTPD